MNSKNIANQIVKESITQALLKLMDKKDFSEITISELTQVAGVGRASFYRNYTSKEDILIQYMTSLVKKEWDEKMLTAINLSDAAIWEVAFELFNLLLPTVILLKKSHLTTLFYDFLCQLLVPTESESLQDSYRRSMTIGLFFSVYDNWLKRGMKETPKQLASMFKNVNINSVN